MNIILKCFCTGVTVPPVIHHPVPPASSSSSSCERQWLEERAELSSRWSWLELRLAELEGRILQLEGVHKHIRSVKVWQKVSVPTDWQTVGQLYYRTLSLHSLVKKKGTKNKLSWIARATKSSICFNQCLAPLLSFCGSLFIRVGWCLQTPSHWLTGRFSRPCWRKWQVYPAQLLIRTTNPAALHAFCTI